MTTRLLRRLLLVLLLVPLAAPAAAIGDGGWFYRGSDIPPDPAWTFGTLPNGLRYAVRRTALPAGQVSVRLRINAGSLHEADAERGFAHYVEHLAFRGTKSFADREARHIWQQLGASFGSDTNAFTGPTQTVYQLDLPRNDAASLDQAIDVLAEMADSALFDPAAVDAERKIVLAEKGRRPELSTRMIETTRPLFYAGLTYAERDPIGTDATLNAATAVRLRAFYERWYRPERATVVMAGDADPAEMERLIARHFGAWRGSGAAPPEPDYGAIATPPQRTAVLAYPGAPHSASLIWLRPYVRQPNTKAREADDLATGLAERILNRRFEARARGEAPFLSAAVGQSRSTNIADTTQLSITAREGRWREALEATFAILADARAAPPAASEIARELSNLRSNAESAVEAESTIRSQQRAQQMIVAIDGNSVVSTAPATLAMLDEFAPQMTPARIGAAMTALFAGSGPRMVLLTPETVAAAALPEALAAAERVTPAERAAERSVSFADLPALGPPGREVSRERIEDMDVTIVRFANGATLTFKRTDFEKGSVLVETRFGGGTAGIDPAGPSLGWTSGIVGPSGLADLDLDGVERLLTGRRMALSFATDEDAFLLRGTTNGQDLADQLRLIATKLAYPRWDAPLFARFKAGALEAYDLSFASAAARAGRELSGFVRGGDARWLAVERETIAATDLPATQAFFDPLLAQGPLTVTIVGDVDLETAVAAVKASVAALPARPGDPRVNGTVAPPPPDPTPRTFTHQGDPNQAFAVIGWTTFGGTDRLQDRRALSLAANIVQVRLFDELREAEGATYSPSAASASSETFADWGIFYAAAEIRPASVDTFFRIARAVIADLAAKPVPADEFARAQNPVVSGIERRVRTNAYWMQVMSDWLRHPEEIAAARSYLADYQRMTAEDVRRAIAAHLADAGDWSMLVLPARSAGGGQ